jgi:hypothetical protein
VYILQGYVLFDVTLTALDLLLFKKILVVDYDSLSYEEQGKYLEEREKECDALDSWYDSHLDKGHCRKVIQYIKNDYKYKKADYDAYTAKIHEEKIQKDNRDSKEYLDKIEYLTNLQEKIKYLNKTFKLDELKDMSKSLKQLINVLTEKPVGLDLVHESFYLYLDEVNSVLQKMSGLDKDARELYISRLSDVVVLLHNEIDNLSARIQKVETNDIEISLNVLLRELSDNKVPDGRVELGEDEDNV